MKAICRGLLLALASWSVAACASLAEPHLDIPSTVNLADYRLTFSEEFETLDVSEWGCTSRWIGHTPWAGDFGDARFAMPRAGFPFTIDQGILSIEARRFRDGQWWSGMLAAWDACDSGWAQKYGYFETRVKFPEGDGFWPSFWLIGVDRSQGTAEIDIFEHHTHKGHRFNVALMRHPGPDGGPREVWGEFVDVPEGSLSERFHVFGVAVGPEEVVFYLDRKEVFRTPMQERFHQPLYPILTLAVVEGFRSETSPPSGTMRVDYVRAYQFRSLSF